MRVYAFVYVYAMDIKRPIQTHTHSVHTTLNIIDQLVEVYFSLKEVHKEFRSIYIGMVNGYIYIYTQAISNKNSIYYIPICITNVFLCTFGLC